MAGRSGAHRYACPVCGERLFLWSRENEDDPYLLTDAGVLHHACPVALRAAMAEHGVPDCERGAREALARLATEAREAPPPLPERDAWTDAQPGRWVVDAVRAPGPD